MPEKTPEPDEYGRYRVTDRDLGRRKTIHAADLPHGNYVVLKQPASNPLTGDPLEPEYDTSEPLSSPTNSGRSADTEKEKAND